MDAFPSFPTLPSAILTLALEDLAVVRDMPGMTIDMSVWLAYTVDGEETRPCAACLAGTVMLQRFTQQASAARVDTLVAPSMLWLPVEVRQALYMLYDFSQGEFTFGLDAYICKGLRKPWITEEQVAAIRELQKRFKSSKPYYETDPSAWATFMLEARDVLVRVGL